MIDDIGHPHLVKENDNINERPIYGGGNVNTNLYWCPLDSIHPTSNQQVNNNIVIFTLLIFNESDEREREREGIVGVISSHQRSNRCA